MNAFNRGGIAGSELPRPLPKKKMVELRPKFSISETDHKALQRACKLLDISVSEWIRRQVNRGLGNE